MYTLGLVLVSATCVLAPVATVWLWRSMQAESEAEAVDPRAQAVMRTSSERLEKGLRNADRLVQDRYAAEKKTPTPAFAQGRHRAPVPTKPEARRYM